MVRFVDLGYGGGRWLRPCRRRAFTGPVAPGIRSAHAGGAASAWRGGSLLAVSRAGAVAEVSSVVGSAGCHRGYEQPCVPARVGAIRRRRVDFASRLFPTPGRPDGVLDDVSKEAAVDDLVPGV